MATIRVVLAEDNVLLREGMSRLVAANEDFELAGAAGGTVVCRCWMVLNSVMDYRFVRV